MPYLDYAADAPMRPVAHDVLLELGARVGNAASPHAHGRRAERAVAKARKQVAALVGRSDREVVWTSGGTEADNLAVFGVAGRAAGRHLIVSAIEHRAVLGPAKALADAGWAVDLLPVDADGVVDLAALERLLRPDTALVSVMAVNNEVGSAQPLAEVARLTRAAGVPLHVDAVQGFYGGAIDAELVSLSAHKLGGPGGVGALLTRVPLAPLMYGGAHERGLRPGSLNVAGIASFGAAAAELLAVREDEAARVAGLRDRLRTRILAGVPGARAVGRPDALAPQILGLLFPGLEGEALITQLDLNEVSASTGAACTTLGLTQGHVLPALGLDAASIAGSLRVSLGWATTEAEVDEAAATIIRVARMLGEMRPMAL